MDSRRGATLERGEKTQFPIGIRIGHRNHQNGAIKRRYATGGGSATPYRALKKARLIANAALRQSRGCPGFVRRRLTYSLIYRSMSGTG
jgi:hypothetical protein